jgi:thioredoxin reductase (NADPH)
MSDTKPQSIHDLVVIGAGAAGLSCAIYAGRARISTLVLEKMLPGGQLMLNHVIENYPGFPDGISGPDLAQHMAQQAARFGARTETAAVTGLDLASSPFQVHLAGADPEAGPRARSLLIATGCSPRKLGVPGEEQLYQHGLSYCATCDGPLFAGKRLVVVGGGNAAIHEALFLASLGSKVTVVHRRDQLRADPILQERALANDNIEFRWKSIVTHVLGDDRVSAVRLRHVETGEETDLPVEGVFISVGADPQTDFLPPEIARDDRGFITSDSHLQTSVPGVFVAGDVRAGAYRQIACAVGDGTLAYRSIRDFIEQTS